MLSMWINRQTYSRVRGSLLISITGTSDCCQEVTLRTQKLYSSCGIMYSECKCERQSRTRNKSEKNKNKRWYKCGDMMLASAAVIVQSWGPMWLPLLWGVHVSEGHFKRLPAFGETDRSYSRKRSLQEPSHAKSCSCQLSPHLNMSPLSAHFLFTASNLCLWSAETHNPCQWLSEDTLQKSFSWPTLISKSFPIWGR